MPITAGTVAPIRPYSMGGNGKSSISTVPLVVAASQTIVEGDCIVFSTGKASVGNTDPTQDTIVGFAVERKTTGASPVDGDLVAVALATPNTVFIGSLVGGADTDQTSFTYGTHNDADFDLVELTTSGFCAVDVSDTAGDIYVIAPAVEQLNGKPWKQSTLPHSNPRVYFMVERSVFTNVLA